MADNKNVFLEIPQGKLMGKTFKDWKQKEYYGFLSIPYAKPPIGELRWKNPLEADPWNGTLDATKDLPQSVQKCKFTGKILGTEDCLYLNVYTPNIKFPSKLPVLVHIHGGGFFEGCGKMKSFGPDYLISEGLVIVSINYRLGYIGNLTTNDLSILQGNYCLHDQVLSFKWIQKNIAYFGGDPNNVTLIGQSAGSISVHYHMLSPLSKGLFHKAILQSGCLTIPFNSRKGTAQDLAKSLGIPTTNEQEMVNQLMQTPADAIVSKQISKLVYMPCELNACAPYFDKNHPNFLSTLPINIIKSGNYSKVPMLIGYNSEEGIFIDILKHLFKYSKYAINYDDLTTAIPNDMEMQYLPEVRKEIVEQMNQFYFKGKSIDEIDAEADDTIMGRVMFQSDIMFKHGVHIAINEHAKSTNSPIYFYEFDMSTNLNSVKNAIPYYKNIKGTAHADELNYIFKKWNRKLQPNSIEENCIEKVVKLWTNFIKTGNPTPAEDSLLNVKWLPVSRDALNCLKIKNDSLEMQQNPSKNRMDFWDRLYELYGKMPKNKL